MMREAILSTTRTVYSMQRNGTSMMRMTMRFMDVTTEVLLGLLIMMRMEIRHTGGFEWWKEYNDQVKVIHYKSNDGIEWFDDGYYEERKEVVA